ncbi:PQQ-binding-like beta-propeller repeat protein [Desertivirga arenae]|uniref:PQQ-binding-like beta-propeller repeat protein n=1 Tax=Desertivirga arenae TaxID=2810309 RepID=UPI001A968632|nr:PQQ-binding-like beta-propeller repeat protein [Pedobacter sp. SYSU D00823]
MKLPFFNKKKNNSNLKEEWNSLGEQYVSQINEMVCFGETHGWDNWKGEEPEDKRDHLAAEVVDLLKEANRNNTVEDFRRDFPPAHAPFISYFEKQGQSIEHLHYIDSDKIVFVTGTPWQKRQAYLLDGKSLIELDESIQGIGKSKRNNVFAFYDGSTITTTHGWQGETIASFELGLSNQVNPTELIPFNDGTKVLIISAEGIYLIDKNEELLIHPVKAEDDDDEDWNPNIAMENGTLSFDNQYVVVGDQCSNHRILDPSGKQIGEIGPQSEYAHFCLFAQDDSQLITNSCHFYNGVTIGVKSEDFQGLNIEPWQESDLFQVMDEGMRVYHGVAYGDIYILGDAGGYIKAIDKNGKQIWRHFLGSTISGMTISDDGKTLWVASCTGIIHKLLLGKGHRDNQTIGNGNHYEEFRLILWKGENAMFW